MASVSPFRTDLLAGQVCLISGGGSGIGAAIADTLMNHGAKVCICSRNEEKLRKAADELNAKYEGTLTSCLWIPCDVRQQTQTDQVVAQTVAKWGRLDTVVNCAAGNFLAAASQLSANAFRTVMEIDALGTFNLSKSAYVGYFERHGKGNIINISATLHYRGDPLQVHAGSAKAAIDAMCKHLAREWGESNVRVNNIAPGPIEGTEGMSRLGGFLPEHITQKIVSRIPCKRFGKKSDISLAVVYLCSEASSYITGNTLVVDGGTWLSDAFAIASELGEEPSVSPSL